MSDGEDINKTTAVKDNFKDSVFDGRVYGYGSKNGTMIEQIDSYGNISNYYVYNDGGYSSGYHISKLDDDNLHNIADKLGITYTYRSTAIIDTKPLDELLADAESEIKNNSTLSYHEGYWICMIVLAAILMWDSCYVITELMRERKFSR